MRETTTMVRPAHHHSVIEDSGLLSDIMRMSGRVQGLDVCYRPGGGTGWRSSWRIRLIQPPRVNLVCYGETFDEAARGVLAEVEKDVVRQRR